MKDNYILSSTNFPIFLPIIPHFPQMVKPFFPYSTNFYKLLHHNQATPLIWSQPLPNSMPFSPMPPAESSFDSLDASPLKSPSAF